MQQNIGRKGGMNRKLLASYRIIFCVTVSAPRSDKMNNPAQSSGRADPGNTG